MNSRSGFLTMTPVDVIWSGYAGQRVSYAQRVGTTRHGGVRIICGSAGSVVAEHRSRQAPSWTRREHLCKYGLPLPGTSPTRNSGSVHLVFSACWDSGANRPPGRCCTSFARRWSGQVAPSWVEKSRLTKRMWEAPARGANGVAVRERSSSWSLPLSSMSRRGSVGSECATCPMSRRPASFPLFAMLSKRVRLSALTGSMPTTP